MNTFPLISVIIPVYNVEPYLRNCIDSVINQTYRDLEIIIVNDGSTDQCPEICDEYKQTDSRVKVIHKKNGGVSSARNAGLDIAAGDWISFVDSDDILHLKMFESLISQIDYDDIDMIQCDSITFVSSNELGKKQKDEVSPGYVDSSKIVLEGTKKIVKAFSFEVQIAVTVWGKIYRRDIFEKGAKLRFWEGRIAEDAEIILKILGKCNKIICLQAQYYFYRLNKNGISGGGVCRNSRIKADTADAILAQLGVYSKVGYDKSEMEAVVRRAKMYMINNYYIFKKINKVNPDIFLNDYSFIIKTYPVNHSWFYNIGFWMFEKNTNLFFFLGGGIIVYLRFLFIEWKIKKKLKKAV